MVLFALILTNNKIRTDRILWNCSDGAAEELFYTRREYKSSDHRPVVAYFRIKVKQIDSERKQIIAKELYQQVEFGHLLSENN